MSLEAQHQSLIDFIFKLANKLRGPYRPPQYRKVMLPLTVLRRLDLVTSENKAEVLTQLEKLKARGLKGNALHEALARYATKNRKQPLYNISKYTLAKLLEDSDHIR